MSKLRLSPRYRNLMRIALTTSALTAAFIPSLSVAQDRSSETTAPSDQPDDAAIQGLQDIIVTAQRRTDTVQKTALAIEVFSGDELRRQGISKPDDLIKISPGVQVGGGTTTQIYVRGVGDFGVTAIANPTVVTSLDGVAISRPQAISGNFFDIDRLELLKGPQGTLYGRNASGGALNILTVSPRIGEYGGYVESTLGNYAQVGLEGALNLPVSENSALRLSFQVNDRDGYLSDGSDDDVHQSLRIQYKYQNDRLTVRPLFSYTHLGGVGTGLALIPSLPGQSAWTGNTDPIAGQAYLAAATAQYNRALARACNPAPAPVGNCPVPPALLANPADSHLFQDIDSYNASFQVDYDLSFATLTVIPGYRRTNARYAVQPSFLYSVGGAYNAAGDRTKGETSDQYSLEARLANETDRLKWVVGAYALVDDQHTDFVLFSGQIQNQRVSSDLKTDAFAAFGQTTYSLTDSLRLTGGLRYTSHTRGVFDTMKWGISPTMAAPSPITGNRPTPCLPGVPAPGANPPGTLCPLLNTTPGFYDSEKTFNKATWKVGVEIDVAPQSMFFADVTTGFKAGGFNLAVSLTNPNELQAQQPETITAYTVGLKNRLLDNRLQLNLEAFYWDYQDLQLSSTTTDGAGMVVNLTQNAGRASVMGADVSLIVMPWTGGTLRGALQYVDSEYEEFLFLQSAQFVPPGRVGCPVSAPNAQGLVTVDCAGQALVRSPEWTLNAGVNQVFDLANGGEVVFDADVAYASSRNLFTDFLPSQRAKSYTNVSSSLTYNSADDWFVSAFVRNATNAEIYNGGGGGQSAYVIGWTTSNIAPPRTYGIRFGARF